MPKISSITIIIVVALAAVLGYGAWTYPRTATIIPISFSFGADSKSVEFDLPPLHDEVQVEVSIKSGAALWTSRITSGNVTAWTHSASQGGQTSYQSGWVSVSQGHYKFVFGTIGLGSLTGEVKVMTKGGPW